MPPPHPCSCSGLRSSKETSAGRTRQGLRLCCGCQVAGCLPAPLQGPLWAGNPRAPARRHGQLPTLRFQRSWWCGTAGAPPSGRRLVPASGPSVAFPAGERFLRPQQMAWLPAERSASPAKMASWALVRPCDCASCPRLSQMQMEPQLILAGQCQVRHTMDKHRRREWL